MTEVVSVSLENEMDLILAYRKSIKVAELLGLTISTQTSFATAVSEVCREVIDKTFEGRLGIGIISADGRYQLTALVTFALVDSMSTLREGFEYAQKLVPELIATSADGKGEVLLKLGIPRSARINPAKVAEVKTYFEAVEALTPYEEVKRRNRELGKINEQHESALLQANYLNELKDEFLSVASHELNTPLTILRSFAQLAIRVEGGKNEQLQTYLRKIEMQSAKLNMLIQQLLDVSKIEMGQVNYNKEQVSVRDFIEHATELARILVPGNRLVVIMEAEACIYIDKLRMEQVLNNLIGNAAKYSANGSLIEVIAALTGDTVVITVKDEGIGMSPETIANVFNKFYRDEAVMRKYNGLGMGLYIASRIVADHGSEIAVESEEGKGSIFRFALPAEVN